jgi:hypothetical protein
MAEGVSVFGRSKVFWGRTEISSFTKDLSQILVWNVPRKSHTIRRYDMGRNMGRPTTMRIKQNERGTLDAIPAPDLAP